MRMSKLYLPTLKEDPAEAEVISHKLMLRAGMMRKHSSGIYSYLPLGYRVIKKIEKITRKHMDMSEAQEVLLPIMQTSEIWKDSKRWDKFGPLMIKFNDRKARETVWDQLTRKLLQTWSEMKLDHIKTCL